MSRRVNCQSHCRGCDQHFNTVRAFDAHRKDGECVTPALEASGVTRDGGEKLLLVVHTTEGYCSLTKGCYRNGSLVNELYPVTIYATAMTEAQRDRLARMATR